MSRNPFLPALVVFLFSSLFSFATTALEGNWERLDGSARLNLKLDSGGRLNGTLTNSQAKIKRVPSRSKPRPLQSVRRWMSSLRQNACTGTVYDCGTRQHRLGSARLQSRDRLLFQSRALAGPSEWKRIS